MRTGIANHFSYYLDEALKRPPIFFGYVAASWDELKTVGKWLSLKKLTEAAVPSKR
jgi:hypothetical protein